MHGGYMQLPIKNYANNFLTLIVLFICFTSYTIAQINWQQANVPSVSQITTLTVNGANLFAGTNLGGAFLSTDNGANWTPINTGLTTTNVWCFAVSPNGAGGTNIFAGTDAGVFLSTNNGTTWTAASSGLTTMNVWSLAVSGTNLFAGTIGGGVFLSTNNGTTWTAANSGITNATVWSVAVSGNSLLAGINGGAFRSTDNGTSWTVITDLTVNTVSDVVAFAVSGTNLFAGTNGGAFRSTDNGISWTSINSGLTDSDIFSFAVNGTNLFAGTIGSGVFLSTNNGASWRSVSTGLTNTDVNALAISGTNLVAGTRGGSIFVSKLLQSPPSITSFTPTSGPIGTTVTIAGTNFEPIAANNIVYFGAVKATVTAATSTSLSITVTTAASYNPITVTNLTTGLTAFSSKPFVVTFPSSQIIDATSFASQVDFMAGVNANSVVISDVDGDGKPDLVVLNSSDNTISIFRNTSTSGTITASSFAPAVNFTTGNSPNSIAISDVDGDGKPDLVVTNEASNTVSIFRNTSSSGSITTSSFVPKVDFTTGTVPICVAIADLDCDGKPDLIVANNMSNSVSIFRNTSTTGSITASSFASKVDLAMTGEYPIRVVISDIDEDGKPDIVVEDFSSKTFSVCKNICSSGTISFAPKVDFTTGVDPKDIALGDIDGDGKPDVVVTNVNDNTVSVFRNTSVSGSITVNSFAPGIRFITGNNPNNVAIGDIDGDGKPDLVIANVFGYTVSVLKNTSVSGSITTSSFASKVDIATSPGSTPYYIAIGDVDGDGKPDLVVANSSSNTISVLRNMIGGSSPHPTITSFTPTRNMLNVAKNTNITVTFNTDINQSTLNNSTIKINGSLSGLHTGNFSYISSTKTVTITPNTQFKVGDLVTIEALRGIINATGDSLHRSYNWSFTIKTNTSSGLFQTNSPVPVGNIPWYITAADLDGNGTVDMAVTNTTSGDISILNNNGSGTFTQSSLISVGGDPRAIVALDVDGDGDMDLATANWSSNTVSILKNNGSGTFTVSSSISVGSNPCAVKGADIDGDGDLDLIVANWSSGTVSILKNDGTGNFTISSTVNVGVNPAWVQSADFNNDGVMDFVVSNYGSGTVLIFSNNGQGTFTQTGSISVGTHPGAMNVLDVDGDGVMDLAVAMEAGTISIYKNYGSGSFSYYSVVNVGNQPSSVMPADIDGDGDMDLVVSNNYSNSLSILKNNGIGIFTQSSTIDVGSYPTSVVAVDMDGNGALDLAVTNSQSNNISILMNTISGSFPHPTITSFAPTRNALNVTKNTNITITFNTDINQSTLDNSTIKINGSLSGLHTSTFSYNSSAYTATIIPNTSFKVGEIVTVALTHGIKNITGDSLPNSYSWQFTIKTNISSGLFQRGTTIQMGTNSNPYSVAAVDVDGNGILDLAVANYGSGEVAILKNDNTGSFTQTSKVVVGSNPNTVISTDVDNDGFPDLIVTNNGSDSISVLKNSGTGTFTTSSVAVGSHPISVTAADFNGDGSIDLAVANNYSGTVSILKNNGNGTFISASTVNVGEYPSSVTAADLNNDGFIDLAVTNSRSNTVSILLNNGAGAFALNASVSVGSIPWNVIAADFNGDGYLDLAVTNNISGTVSLLRNDGTGNFTLTSTLNLGGNASSVTAVDVNGDGSLDLAIGNNTLNTLSIWINNGVGSFTAGSVVNVESFPCSSTAADFNGDGKIELVTANGYGNTISILMNGTSTDSLVAYYPFNGNANDTSGNGYNATFINATPTVDRFGIESRAYSFNGVDNYIDCGDILDDVFCKDTAQFTVSGWAKTTVMGNVHGEGNVIIGKTAGGLGPYQWSISHNSGMLFGSVFSDSNVNNYQQKYMSIGTDKWFHFVMIFDGKQSVNNRIRIFVNNTSNMHYWSGSGTLGTSTKNTSLHMYVGGQTHYSQTPQNLYNGSLDDIRIYNRILSIEEINTLYHEGGWDTTNHAPITNAKVVFTMNLKGPVYAGISVLGDNAMYAIASGDAVYRMNTAGSVAYTLQVAGDIRSSSSIAYDTTVYIASSDRILYAFSKDGNSIWSLPTGGVLTATPVIDSIANRLYIGVSNHNFIAVNRSTGKVDWNYFADEQISNSAVVTNDRKLIFATQKGSIYGFDLNNITLPATPSWQIALPDTAPSSIALDNQGYIYVGTSAGRLLKISMPTNQQPSIIWQVSLGQAIVGSPVIDASGTLYTGSLDAKLYAVDIQSGSVKWAFSTKGAIRSTPAISDVGTIFVANDSGEVISLDTSKNILWYYKSSSAITAPLLYYKSTLYVGTLGNQVIALSDVIDSTQSLSLPKSDAYPKIVGKPVWATFQGNNQRTGMFSSSIITGIKNSSSELPINYTLMQNYPNPFNPSTTIQFALPKEGRISIKIFNILGKHIATLLDGFQSAGYHEVTVNMDSFSSGIYFYQMRVGSFIETKKMMLMK
jgi:6-phosphogluconolactonase (cycloisomerase 2 family)